MKVKCIEDKSDSNERIEVYIRSVLLKRSDDRGSAGNIIRSRCPRPVMKSVKSVTV